MLSGIILRNIIYSLESSRCNFHDLLEEISVSPTELYKKDLVLTPNQMGIFSEKIVKRLNDNRLGLRIGFESPFSALGILGQLYQNCNTYADVLKNMIKYVHLLDSHNIFSYEIKQDGIYHIRQSNPDWKEKYPLANRQAAELYLGLTIRSRRELMGREVKPLKIFTPYPKEGERDLLEEYFKCPIIFNAEYTCFVLPLEVLDWEVPTANPAALQLYQDHIRQINTNRYNWSENTKQHINYQLRNTSPSLSQIASLMNLSARSLQRNLKNEGVTFQELLDQVRHESARYLLSQTKLSISEVSEMLGFEVQNSFNRFLQKREGKTPLELRKELNSQSNISE